MDDNKATEYVKTAFKNKWQILGHTNGDAAIDQYIKAIKAAEEEFGYIDHRTVMIHGQTLRKDQIPELVSLNILPSLFPMHTFYWGDWLWNQYWVSLEQNIYLHVEMLLMRVSPLLLIMMHQLLSQIQ